MVWSIVWAMCHSPAVVIWAIIWAVCHSLAVVIWAIVWAVCHSPAVVIRTIVRAMCHSSAVVIWAIIWTMCGAAFDHVLDAVGAFGAMVIRIWAMGKHCGGRSQDEDGKKSHDERSRMCVADVLGRFWNLRMFSFLKSEVMPIMASSL